MARQRNWIIYSFQEQYGLKALGGNKVVEDSASCLNDAGIEVVQRISSNHMDMCRFRGLDDIEYRKVVGTLSRVDEAIKQLFPLPTRTALSVEDRRSYFKSLMFDQIGARHAAIKVAHAKTCTWLLNKPEYQAWQDVNKLSDHYGFLWIEGHPGTGKSTIMKFAYDQSAKRKTDNVVISFFFNARGGPLEKSTAGLYRSLLFQLLQELPELQSLFDSLGPTTPDSQGESFDWRIETVQTLFSHAVEKLGQRRLICFIDALDECEEDEVREMVLFFEHLGKISMSAKCQAFICFSSRHYPHITLEKSIQLILEGQEGHLQDIANYLHSQLRTGRSRVIEQIKDEILERASGIFLWVVLVVKMLNKEYDRDRVHALRKRLDEIPNGLEELFHDILTRDGQNMEELILCLQWVLFASRPLKREELYFGILSGVEPTAIASWSPEDIEMQDIERFILNASKGLVEVTRLKYKIVQFIHESVRDFLLKGTGLSKIQPNLGANFAGISHDRLKMCCQSYINITSPKLLRSGLPSFQAPIEDATNFRNQAFSSHPFLKYAVHNVLHHADAASGHGVPQDDFVEGFPRKDWIILKNSFEKFEVRHYEPDRSMLYILAKQDLPNLMRIEIAKNPNFRGLYQEGT